MKNKKELSQKFWFILLIITLIMIIIVAVGFGVFAGRDEEVIEENENGGDIILNYSSNYAGIVLRNANPTLEAVGKKSLDEGEYFDFSIDTALDNAAEIQYEISILKDEKNSTISDKDIRIYLEQEQSGSYVEVFGPDKYIPIKEKTEYGTPVGSMVLFHSEKTKNTTDRYRLRVWLSNEANVSGNYSVEVFVNGKTN